jgi:hypothetical protein
MSCDGAAGDILQFQMMEATGRSAWLRIQKRYAGSSSLKIGAMHVDLFRPVTIVDSEGSIAVNRWFTGWKTLRALTHELKMEALLAVSELYLPGSIYSITF